MKNPNHLRTWIEIDAAAARKNYDTFRGLIGKKVKLWAVVKSNAYGHGLYAFSELMDRFGIDGLCVDSVVEGSGAPSYRHQKTYFGPRVHAPRAVR